jgi:hypothetical protein
MNLNPFKYVSNKLDDLLDNKKYYRKSVLLKSLFSLKLTFWFLLLVSMVVSLWLAFAKLVLMAFDYSPVLAIIGVVFVVGFFIINLVVWGDYDVNGNE